MAAKPKKIVFISHIGEEKLIAIALKELVELCFLKLMDVFVASDETSILMGHNWLSTIESHVRVCVVEIVILSPVSVKRPWIILEAGAGWGRDIPVIPLCHSGLTPGTLPPPFDRLNLQGGVATIPTELKRIVSVLAQSLGANAPEPDFTAFIQTVEEHQKLSKESEALTHNSLLPSTGELSAIEVAALRAIAGFPESIHSYVKIENICQAMNDAGFHSSAASIALKMLERKEFVSLSEPNFESVADIGLKGWEWLARNQAAIDFGYTPPPTPPLPF